VQQQDDVQQQVLDDGWIKTDVGRGPARKPSDYPSEPKRSDLKQNDQREPPSPFGQQPAERQRWPEMKRDESSRASKPGAPAIPPSPTLSTPVRPPSGPSESHLSFQLQPLTSAFSPLSFLGSLSAFQRPPYEKPYSQPSRIVLEDLKYIDGEEVTKPKTKPPLRLRPGDPVVRGVNGELFIIDPKEKTPTGELIVPQGAKLKASPQGSVILLPDRTFIRLNRGLERSPTTRFSAVDDTG